MVCDEYFQFWLYSLPVEETGTAESCLLSIGYISHYLLLPLNRFLESTLICHIVFIKFHINSIYLVT